PEGPGWFQRKPCASVALEPPASSRPSIALLQSKETRRERVRIEANEIRVVRATDPVVHPATGLTQIRRSLEQHRISGLPPFHLDRILVRPTAVALECRFPRAVHLGHFRIELRAHHIGLRRSLRGIEVRPGTGPVAGNIQRLRSAATASALA